MGEGALLSIVLDETSSWALPGRRWHGRGDFIFHHRDFDSSAPPNAPGRTSLPPTRRNTTRTGMPILMAPGSIWLIGPSAEATRLPTRRSVGSSASSTTITLYGASCANTGSSGGCGNANDRSVLSRQPFPRMLERLARRTHRPRRETPPAAERRRFFGPPARRGARPPNTGRRLDRRWLATECLRSFFNPAAGEWNSPAAADEVG